jgi:uncharacterized protein
VTVVPDPVDLGWLCQDFVQRTPGAAHAVVISSDGIQLAASKALPAGRAEEVASISSGLVSLALGAAQCFEAGAVVQTAVEMERGYLFLMAISDGSCLTVLAAPDCNAGQVGHQMGRFVERAGKVLTPELRNALVADSPAIEARAAKPRGTRQPASPVQERQEPVQ